MELWTARDDCFQMCFSVTKVIFKFMWSSIKPCSLSNLQTRLINLPSGRGPNSYTNKFNHRGESYNEFYLECVLQEPSQPLRHLLDKGVLPTFDAIMIYQSVG